MSSEEFSLPMKVAGRAVEFFGSQSITSDSTAVFELIKNSRDADATSVEIKFENLGKNNAKMIISDNGDGMTFDEVMNKWLVIATDTKLVNPKSRSGKDVWGEFGYGRLACERLAKKVIMTSFPRGSNEMITMTFDWEKYKKPGITFNEVKHPGTKKQKAARELHGLTLELEGLNSEWDQRKINTLASELGTFILPKELKGPDDIEILISAAQLGIKAHQVEGTVAKIAPIKMTSTFKDGELSVSISDIDYNQGASQHIDVEETFDQAKCGPFVFNLYFYPQDPAKVGTGRWSSYYEKKLKDLDIGDFLREHSGIYLYRDGAWMKPLGKKNDWLGLESRRVQRRDRIGLTQVYGVVRISQKQNPGIRPTAHRETIQQNDALDDLQKILIKAIIKFESYRKDKRTQEKLATSAEIPPAEIMAKNNLDALTKLLNQNKDKLTPSTFKKLKTDLSATKRYVESLESEKEEEIQKFGELRHHEDTVAAIGLLTSYMAAEIIGPLNNNVSVMKEVRKMMEATDFSKGMDESVVKDGWGWLGSLEKNTQRMMHFVSFVQVLSKHISLSVRAEGKPAQVSVYQAWDNVANGFKDLTKDNDIVVWEGVDRNLKVRFNMIDLEAILANLFLNSIDILKRKKEGNRKIICDIDYDKNGLNIKFVDNGRGIPSKHVEKIFEPFYTVKEKIEDAAHGQGLGLAIVKKIVDRWDGNVTAQSPPSAHSEGLAISIKIPSAKVPKVASIK